MKRVNCHQFNDSECLLNVSTSESASKETTGVGCMKINYCIIAIISPIMILPLANDNLIIRVFSSSSSSSFSSYTSFLYDNLPLLPLAL